MAKKALGYFSLIILLPLAIWLLDERQRPGLPSIDPNIVIQTDSTGQQILLPPSHLRVYDNPNDEGGSIMLEWSISPNDISKSLAFSGYNIYRATSPEGPFEVIADATGGETEPSRHLKSLADGNNVKDGQAYYYYVEAKMNGQKARSEIAGPVKSSAQWYHTGRFVGWKAYWRLDRERCPAALTIPHRAHPGVVKARSTGRGSPQATYAEGYCDNCGTYSDQLVEKDGELLWH